MAPPDDKESNLSDAATKPRPTRKGSYHHALIIASAYLAGYAALDWVSFIFPFEGLRITPWNPAPALGLVLLLRRGFRWMPLLVVAPLLTDTFLHDFPPPQAATLITDIAEAAIYAFGAWIIIVGFKVSTKLDTLRDIIGLMVGAQITTTLMSSAYVGTYYLLGTIAQDQILHLFAKYWVGEMIGIMVVAPLLLIHSEVFEDCWRVRALLSWEIATQIAAFGIGLGLMFYWRMPDGRHVYPMFVPLVWVAARHGLAGVTLAMPLVQSAIIVVLVTSGANMTTVTKVQFLLLTMTVTGLLLGTLITERERGRKALASSEGRLRAIIDLAPAGILVTDEHGRVEAVNAQIEQISGASPAELCGRLVGELISLAGTHPNTESVFHHQRGGKVPVEVSTSTANIDGRTISVVSVRDLAEHKLKEESRNRHRSTLEAIARSTLTEEVAAALAHELNQPLSALIGYAGACRKIIAQVPEVPARALDHMASAVRQAERAATIVRRLKEFFQNGHVEPAAVDLLEMVEGVMALIGDEIARCGVSVVIRVAPRLTVFVDRLQIEQVLLNLIRNSLAALEGLDREPRQISIASGAGQDEAEVVLSVADNGDGIPGEVADRIFHPFITTRPDGMGLGLSISRSIIESHGCRLWFEPTDPAGTAFRFTLPRVIEHAHALS